MELAALAICVLAGLSSCQLVLPPIVLLRLSKYRICPAVPLKV